MQESASGWASHDPIPAGTRVRREHLELGRVRNCRTCSLCLPTVMPIVMMHKRGWDGDGVVGWEGCGSLCHATAPLHDLPIRKGRRSKGESGRRSVLLAPYFS